MGFTSVLLFILGVVVADQLIKLWVSVNLVGQASIVLIPGLLKLTYVENYGAAFGIMKGMREFLVLFTACMLVGLLWAIYAKKIQGKWMTFSFAMIIAGGIGNLIDRVRMGYVVDYLDICDWFSYPVFNLADCFVVIGAIMMMVYVIFIEPKEEKKEQ